MNQTAMPIADKWFERTRVDEAITLLWEPHVIELMRCNIWHVSGADVDLVIDTGMGVSSLAAELVDLADKSVVAIATHGHGDHIGSHHEFDTVVAHPAEAELLENELMSSLNIVEEWGQEGVDMIQAAGYDMSASHFVDALPPGVLLESFQQQPARVTRLVDEGDVIDIGDRQFEVLHLPGHSPGSIGLWEARSGTLFSGDAIYDGPLLDELPDSNIDDYCETMERLLRLPVSVVHGGHDPSFDGHRLREIARSYLQKRST